MDKPIPEAVRAVDHAVTVLMQRGQLGAADQLNRHRPAILAALTAAQQPGQWFYLPPSLRRAATREEAEAYQAGMEAGRAQQGQAVACDRCGDSKQEFNYNGDGPYPCRHCTTAPQPAAEAVDADYNYGLQFIRDRAGTIRDFILALCAGPTERYVVEKTLQHLTTQHQEPT